ncbi:unnamed protein product [Effrenium voratum]|nr:unnamed protein product [Effrenium voratum]
MAWRPGRRCCHVALLGVLGFAFVGIRTHRGGAPKVRRAAVLPIGPFCPFASPQFINLCTDPAERRELEATVGDMNRLAETEPDGAALAELGARLRKADGPWRGRLLRMRHANDFQTKELYEFLEAHLETFGVRIFDVERFAAWQADTLQAMSRGRPPPPTPPKSQHLLGLLDSFRFGQAQQLTADFALATEGAAPVVEDERSALQADHVALIGLGQAYGSFDAAGKLIFLDKMADIAERWKVYLERLRLMGEAAPFPEAQGLLSRLGLEPAEANGLVGEAHARLRGKAGQSEA